MLGEECKRLHSLNIEKYFGIRTIRDGKYDVNNKKRNSATKLNKIN